MPTVYQEVEVEVDQDYQAELDQLIYLGLGKIV